MKFGTMKYIGPYSGKTIKISNLKKSNMVEIAILKIRKIVLSHQKIDQSLRNLAQ